MPTFHEWLADVRQKASQTPIGIKMHGAGFELVTTGGRCLAWERREVQGPFQVLITVDEEDPHPSDEIGSEFTEADLEATRWIVGVYDEEGAYYGDAPLGITAALTLAEQFAKSPAEHLAKGYRV